MEEENGQGERDRLLSGSDVPGSEGQEGCFGIRAIIVLIKTVLSQVGCTAICIIALVVVGMLLTARVGLFITRYSIIGLYCNTSAVPIDQDPEYLFTTIVYGIVSVLRVIEYLVLGIGLFKFWFRSDGKIQCGDCVSRKGLLWSILMTLYISLGIAVPIAGVFQEKKYAEDLNCPKHNTAIYYAYCAMNLAKYLLSFGARILLICTMMTVRKIWFPDDTQPTSRSHQHQFTIVNIEEDWKHTSLYHDELTRKYEDRGREVQQLINIFKKWFLFPWIAYILVSSLQTYNIAKPWSYSKEVWDLPTIHLLLYNTHQIITILIPYLCAQRINSYHQKFYLQMREDQLHKFSDNSSRLAFARTQNIEKEEYDFVPTVVGTSIKVRMNSALYVVVLLLGAFFTVTETLLQRNKGAINVF